MCAAFPLFLNIEKWTQLISETIDGHRESRDCQKNHNKSKIIGALEKNDGNACSFYTDSLPGAEIMSIFSSLWMLRGCIQRIYAENELIDFGN